MSDGRGPSIGSIPAYRYSAPTMPVPDVLRKLLTAPGPSGYEQAAAAVFRDAASAFAEVTHDSVGSTVARVQGTAGGPLLAVVGHIDEIGLIVHHIDDEGFLWFSGVGGWDPVILVGQRVELATRDGHRPRRGRARSRSTCSRTRSARRRPSCATCTSTSAPPTATRRAGGSASATSR